MTNRLSEESSPYLLQHKDNPVDWYPWGPEARDRAREEDRPILLSIGYSACHWCHVMERESFEDPDTAELMNGSFVNVKVDREERPDVDSVYMTAVQAMTGRGGWPLTVFLTPDGVPFYGGTYFPPVPRQGMPSFRQVLRAIHDAWNTRRNELRDEARKLVAALEAPGPAKAGATAPARGEGDVAGEELLRGAVRLAASAFDEVHGGFGGPPRFPRAPLLDFLLRRSVGGDGGDPRRMVDVTLDAMAGGGIRDHLGGGFHRYAVDARWLVPHFEKMLYDNALLARLYLDHYRATGHGGSLGVALETLDYLLEDLRSPEGGFYASRDADSEGEEGRFYVWGAQEVDEVLGPEEGPLFRFCYDVSDAGNWEGENILHLPRPLGDAASARGLDVEELRERLLNARTRLLRRRRRREPPRRDEKVLAGWNGLALRALADAGAALGRTDFTEAARSGADFVLAELRRDGRLLHSWKEGDARVPGFLDDYASMGNALLSLHEATLEGRWLDEARWCVGRILELFWSEDEAVFHDTPVDGEQLLIRPRDTTDDPSPSGSSLAVELLMRSADVFGEDGWREVALRSLEEERAMLARHPLSFGALLAALDRHASDPLEVAVVGNPEADDTRALLRTVHGRLAPRRVVVGRKPAEEPPPGVPLLHGREPEDGRATAWVCRNRACRAPVTEPHALASELDAVANERGTMAGRTR